MEKRKEKYISIYPKKETVCGIRDLNIRLFLLKQFLFRKKKTETWALISKDRRSLVTMTILAPRLKGEIYIYIS